MVRPRARLWTPSDTHPVLLATLRDGEWHTSGELASTVWRYIPPQAIARIQARRSWNASDVATVREFVHKRALALGAEKEGKGRESRYRLPGGEQRSAGRKT